MRRFLPLYQALSRLNCFRFSSTNGLFAAMRPSVGHIISGISKKVNSDAFDGVFAGCVPHVTAGMKREAVQISSGFVASVG